jgi:hypothetical protein
VAGEKVVVFVFDVIVVVDFAEMVVEAVDLFLNVVVEVVIVVIVVVFLVVVVSVRVVVVIVVVVVVVVVFLVVVVVIVVVVVVVVVVKKVVVVVVIGDVVVIIVVAVVDVVAVVVVWAALWIESSGNPEADVNGYARFTKDTFLQASSPLPHDAIDVTANWFHRFSDGTTYLPYFG